MIKKILHLYWGKNQPLSYFRSLTVTTFRKLNPDWEVRIWVPKKPSGEVTWATGEHPVNYDGKDYLATLEGIREFDFESIGVPCSLPEVHKSDLLRWYLLGTQGGIWSDFDILYVQPLNAKVAQNWKGAGLCKYEVTIGQEKNYQAIGFLSSSGSSGKRFFMDLFHYGIPKGTQSAYQAFGAHLLEDFLENEWRGGDTPFYLAPDLVYPYRHNNDFYKYFADHTVEYQGQETIGLHWYAGNPKNAKQELQITPDNIMESDWAICKEAVRVLWPEKIKKPAAQPLPAIKYSILMPYYCRSEQLRSTLLSFVDHYKGRKDYEVIIANDVKSSAAPGEDDKLAAVVVEFKQDINIKVIQSGAEDCWNPAPAFEKMAQAAVGEFLVITNPECVHRANVLKGLDEEFTKDPLAYVICGCFSVDKIFLATEQEIPMGHWYQHSEYRNVECHFCSALHRKVYAQAGGFDLEYGKGMGFDDDDFRNRLKKNRIKFVHRDDLLTVHLAHFNNHPADYLKLHDINKKYYESVWGPAAPRAEAYKLTKPTGV